MLQCPLCTPIPATCLTQDGVPAVLAALGYYYCTAQDPYMLVKPLNFPDSAPVE